MTDRTLMAVTTQLAAMGCPSFEIGVRDAQAGKMMNREWSRDEVITNLGWLKHMNVKGNDVYVRPKAQWHHLVLVDDVDLETIARMRRDGFAPALVDCGPITRRLRTAFTWSGMDFGEVGRIEHR